MIVATIKMMSLIFIIIGFVYLVLNIFFQKKGKVFIEPWRKTLYGRRESWWIERDNLEDLSLYWHVLIIQYIASIVIIVVGIIFSLIEYGLIQLPHN